MSATLESIVNDFDELGKYIERETGLSRHSDPLIAFDPRRMSLLEPVMTMRPHIFKFVHSTDVDVSVQVAEQVTENSLLLTTFSILDGVARSIVQAELGPGCSEREKLCMVSRWSWIENGGYIIRTDDEALVVGQYILECIMANFTSANL